MTALERREALCVLLRTYADCNPAGPRFADAMWAFVQEACNDTVQDALDLCRVLREHSQSTANATSRRDEREWLEGEVSALEDAEHDIATLKVKL